MKKTIERLCLQSGRGGEVIIIERAGIQVRANVEVAGVILRIEGDLIELTIGEIREVAEAMEEMADTLEGEG